VQLGLRLVGTVKRLSIKQGKRLLNFTNRHLLMKQYRREIFACLILAIRFVYSYTEIKQII